MALVRQNAKVSNLSRYTKLSPWKVQTALYIIALHDMIYHEMTEERMGSIGKFFHVWPPVIYVFASTTKLYYVWLFHCTQS